MGCQSPNPTLLVTTAPDAEIDSGIPTIDGSSADVSETDSGVVKIDGAPVDATVADIIHVVDASVTDVSHLDASIPKTVPWPQTPLKFHIDFTYTGNCPRGLADGGIDLSSIHAASYADYFMCFGNPGKCVPAVHPGPEFGPRYTGFDWYLDAFIWNPVDCWYFKYDGFNASVAKQVSNTQLEGDLQQYLFTVCYPADNAPLCTHSWHYVATVVQ